MEKITRFKIEVACDFKDIDDRKYLYHLDDKRSRIKTRELDNKIQLTYFGSISKSPSDNALDFIDEVHKYVTNDQIADEIAYCVFGAVYSLDSGEEHTRIQANFDRKYSIKMEIPSFAGHVNVTLYQKDENAGEVFRAVVNPRFALKVIMKRFAAFGLVADYKSLKLICEELLSRYEDGVSAWYVTEISLMDAETRKIRRYNLYLEIPR